MSLESRLRDKVKQITARKHLTDRDEVLALALKEVADALQAERMDAMRELDRIAKGKGDERTPWTNK